MSNYMVVSKAKHKGINYEIRRDDERDGFLATESDIFLFTIGRLEAPETSLSGSYVSPMRFDSAQKAHDAAKAFIDTLDLRRRMLGGR